MKDIVKWIAVAAMMTGAILNTVNIFPINIMFLTVGVSGLLYSAIFQKDKPYMILNSFFIIVYVIGLVKYYV